MKRQLAQVGGVFALAAFAALSLPAAAAFGATAGAGASGGGSGSGGTAPPAFNSTTCPTITVPPAGGTVNCNGATVTIPSGSAGSDSINVTVTTTPVSAVTIPGAPAGFGVAYAVTVSLTDANTGAKYTGTLNPPATVTITNPAIVAGDPIYEYINGAWTQVTNATVTNGSATFSIPSDPEFAFLAATSTSTVSPIAGSTTAVTGKPVVGEGILAGLLFALGLFGVWRVTRRRAPSQV